MTPRPDFFSWAGKATGFFRIANWSRSTGERKDPGTAAKNQRRTLPHQARRYRPPETAPAGNIRGRTNGAECFAASPACNQPEPSPSQNKETQIMCGIVGILEQGDREPINQKELRQMLAV